MPYIDKDFPLCPELTVGWDQDLCLIRFTDQLRERTGFADITDALDHLGKEVALRCTVDDPQAAKKELSRRELITPVLHMAAFLTGQSSQKWLV